MAAPASRGVAAPAVRAPAGHAHASARAAAAFALAAAVIAVVDAVAPVPRGGWLVAYLLLVGGVAQAALGEGLRALARHGGAPPPGGATAWPAFAAFNAGTVLVAAADVAGATAGVLAGSVLLLVALALFAHALHAVARSSRRPVRAGVACYATLLAFLLVSVITGAGLAGALPGQ